MKVTLDIFSGRPNPSWTLGSEDEEELARRLAGLPRTKVAPGAGDLGYRGFVISRHDAGSGLPAEIRVFGGVVTVKDNADIAMFRDTNHLEKWLAEQAREKGLEDLLVAVPQL